MNARQRRIQQLEQQAQPPYQPFEVWLGEGDDDVMGPNGEVMSLAEFREHYPDAVEISGPHTYKE